MKNVKIELKPVQISEFEYNGVTIEVKSMLLLHEQIAMIRSYVADYFTPFAIEKRLVPSSEVNYLEAEYNLISHVFQACTNIDVNKIDIEICADYELWSNVTKRIENFKDFRYKLNKIVEDMKNEAPIKALMEGLSVADTDELNKEVSKLSDELRKLSPIGIKEK